MIIWASVIVVMLIVEMNTVSMVSIWFAGGALAAMIAAICGAALTVQIVLFLAVSGVLLATIYPFVKNRIRRKTVCTNLDRIIGMTAVVTEPVDNLAGVGAVKVDGKVWTARTADSSTAAAGDLVRIAAIEGAKVIVEKLPVNV